MANGGGQGGIVRVATIGLGFYGHIKLCVF
jgi:hypothetical protein